MKEQMRRVCYFLIERKKLLQQPNDHRTVLIPVNSYKL